MGEPVCALSFDGWRREAAKRPIETEEQRDAWLLLCESAGLTSGELASMCGVSRQTASGWLHKPESTLPWARFEEVARLTLERQIAAISEANERHGEAWRYLTNKAVSEMQDIADTVTGMGDDERRAHKEMGARLGLLMQIYAMLDEDRQIALERVALDMLIAHEREREQEEAE